MDEQVATPTQSLLAEIEAFCADRVVSRTAFGLAAVNDPNFFSDLESGREPRWATIARVRAAMRNPELWRLPDGGSVAAE